MPDMKHEFRAGVESARIQSHKAAIGRALQIGIAMVVAWLVPVSWWAKLLIFVAIMFVIGVIAQYREISRTHPKN